MTFAEDMKLHQLLEEAKKDGCEELKNDCENCTMALINDEGDRVCAIEHVIDNL